MQRYYLADDHDTARVGDDGHIYPAHDCAPMYFGTPSEAYAYCQSHPNGEFLRVYAVAGAETVPGLPSEAIFAADVIDHLKHDGRNKFLSNYAEAILDGE